MKNIKSGTKTKKQKEECFNECKVILDYIYYLGEGFCLKRQIIPIVCRIEEISAKEIQRKFTMLTENGLLIQKQILGKTNVYVMNKFALSKYKNKESGNVTAIRLNNTKIMKNIFRLEYIMQEILPKVPVHSVTELRKQMYEKFIDLYRCPNQESVFLLYQQFYKEFPVKGKQSSKYLPQGEFANDYLACTAELYQFLIQFRHDEKRAEKYGGYGEFKRNKALNDVFYNSTTEKNKYCYNLYNMISQGFLMTSKLRDNQIDIILFDIYTHLTVDKIYKNAVYILLMLQRYLSIVPEINLTVFIRNEETKERLMREELHKSYDYVQRESSGYCKRDDVFYRLGVLAWKDNIRVSYKNYDIETKYHI